MSMEYVIAGLGNPGEEYEETRHNVGRMVVLKLQEKWNTSDWRDDAKTHAKLSQGEFLKGNVQVRLVLPETYMNRSGAALTSCVKKKSQLQRLIVVHDDIDLGIGTLRIVLGRGAGGHKGVESIEKALGSKEYIRLRVGVSPITSNGKVKKPKGEEAVHTYILKRLTKKEKESIDKIVEYAVVAIEALLTEGPQRAMCTHNKTHNLSGK